MKHFYMDTNVFISQMKPDDTYHTEARIMMKSLEEGYIYASTSVFTLLETASVLTRLYEANPGRRTQRERSVFVIKALKRLAAAKVNFIHMAGDQSITFGNVQIRMPSIFNEAIVLGLQIAFRTLDLIHVVAARHARRINTELGVFVTGDNGFLSKKRELSQIIGMPILSPKEYVEGLGLKR